MNEELVQPVRGSREETRPTSQRVERDATRIYSSRQERSPAKGKVHSSRENSDEGGDENLHSSWVEKIVSNISVKSVKKTPTMQATSSRSPDQQKHGVEPSQTTVSLVRGCTQYGRETSGDRRKTEYLGGKSDHRQAKSDVRETEPGVGDRRRGPDHTDIRHGCSSGKRSMAGSSRKSKGDEEEMVWVEQTHRKRHKHHRSSSSSRTSSTSDSSDGGKKRKRRASTQSKKKARTKGKTSKRSRERVSSSSSPSPAPAPKKKRSQTTSLVGKTVSTPRSQGPAKGGPMPKPSVGGDGQHTREASGALPPAADRKLNELEDFLKELKTKKREQLMTEGKGKKT